MAIKKMNKKTSESLKKKTDLLLRGRSKNTKLNLHIVNNLKNHLQIKSLKDVHISNLLNLKIKDIDEIELGTRELSLKDLNLICNRFGINPDHLLNFEDVEI
ncbi:MAG: hypothetical protein LBQ34_02660 [Alphaproteobacteria bacterium]|jgi:hypothetical protein|nr:hypothetical protein [Alphaproteobacteria bacterium]